MGKGIDFEGLQRMMEGNPDDWYSEEEASARTDAALKKALGVTGPKVSVVDLKSGAWRLEVDFDTIERRGCDKAKAG